MLCCRAASASRRSSFVCFRNSFPANMRFHKLEIGRFGSFLFSPVWRPASVIAKRQPASLAAPGRLLREGDGIGHIARSPGRREGYRHDYSLPPRLLPFGTRDIQPEGSSRASPCCMLRAFRPVRRMLLSVRLTKCCGEVASLPSYAAVFFELSPGGFLVRPNEQTILRCFNFFATRRHFFFLFKEKKTR